ncbi:cache domain-containing sensor histidine kinase [Murimonas intestini]|uniref:cache domain-containing sensor histidine kinase n=1 Tax=Murimonas intestini TaxID=1337051 RepID=UPI0011DD4E3D|nr:sensor histidine kinase [Murimonas intestini]
MKKKSFIRSLMVSYLWTAILPLAVILGIFFVNTVKNSQNIVEEKAESSARLISAQIQSLMDNMSFLSVHLVNNIMFSAKGLNYPHNTLVKEEQYYSGIQSECCSYAIEDSLYRVIFFTDRGYYIKSEEYNVDYNCRYRLPGEELEGIGWLETARTNYGKSLILPVNGHKIPLDDRKTLTLARAIRDPGKVVGYLCIQVEAEYLDEIFKIGEQSGAEVLLFDSSQGETVYSTSGFPSELVRTEDQTADLSLLEKDYLVIREEELNGLTTVLISPRKEIYASALQEICILLVEGIGLLVLTVFFICYYTRKMTKPLKVLTAQMSSMTLENLNAGEENTVPPSYDEIRYLYEGYQDMQRHLDQMIQKEIASKTLRIQERLSSLQAQINPHFLYNTLNVIGIMGSEARQPRIYRACLRLSSLLRYSIADKNDSASTIGMEIENITGYLELMKLRFEHHVEYRIQCGQELENVEVPRLFLQPFVENVFEHAYNGEQRVVHILISCRQEGEWTAISVMDDGRGMGEEELEHLKERIEEHKNTPVSEQIKKMKDGIGVENTIMRLSFFFGEDFRYSLENREEGGFRVLLMIKRKVTEEDEKDQSADCGG